MLPCQSIQWEVATMPYVNNHGIRLHYQVEGAGPPLVLQHGFSDSLESWYEMGYVTPLKQDYRLILIDARGHGASDKPHDPAAYTLQQQAADVVAVLDALAIPTAHFFGYSMGGRIGFALAKYVPTRFPTLIMSGASPYGAPRDIQDQFLRRLQQGAAAFLGLWEQEGTISPALKARILANDMEALSALWTTRMAERTSLEDVLPTMTQSCLLIAGTQDWSYKVIEECSQHIPQVTFIPLPDLNHLEGFCRSDLVLPHITQFLATLPC
jgi:pimeloyl-ACP methyl ester carboxylesterase